MTTDEAIALVDRNAVITSFTLLDKQVKVVEYSKVLNIVKAILNEFQPKINELDRENALKDAKIFAYETILQNSNFKMAVVRKKEEK